MYCLFHMLWTYYVLTMWIWIYAGRSRCLFCRGTKEWCRAYRNWPWDKRLQGLQHAWRRSYTTAHTARTKSNGFPYHRSPTDNSLCVCPCNDRHSQGYQRVRKHPRPASQTSHFRGVQQAHWSWHMVWTWSKVCKNQHCCWQKSLNLEPIFQFPANSHVYNKKQENCNTRAVNQFERQCVLPFLVKSLDLVNVKTRFCVSGLKRHPYKLFGWPTFASNVILWRSRAANELEAISPYPHACHNSFFNSTIISILNHQSIIQGLYSWLPWTLVS